MADPRVWIIGESNPYQADPEDGLRFAMYPDPPESAGGRFCDLILGMHRRDYIRAFMRRNVLHERWSAPLAREAAACLSWEFAPGDVVLLLGQKVQAAFFPEREFRAAAESLTPGPFAASEARPDVRWVFLPHPSGRNPYWNRYISYSEVRRTVAVAAPHLTPLLARAATTRARVEEEREVAND